MSDEPSTPSGPEPIPLSQAQPFRPPTGKKPPPPPAAPSKVKAYLVVGIIVSTVVLLGLIGWRLYVKLTTKVVPPRNVKVEYENAWNRARNANKEVFENLEAKVWTKGEELTPEDYAKLKSNLEIFQKTAETYHELIELLRKEKKLDSQEARDIGSTQIILKTWIWDANGLLDPANKPPKYGGLYIPMYRAEVRREKASAQLNELRTKAPEIVAKGDAAEIEKAIKEARALIDTFAAIRDDLLALDDELLKGLTLPDLKVEQLQDLEDLRLYQSKASMGIKEAREVRSKFPDPGELKPKPDEPPKEEPKPEPKDEPKKEPPKDEKKEEPPKEEPPKEEPKKEPPKEEPKPEPKEEQKKEPPREEPPK